MLSSSCCNNWLLFNLRILFLWTKSWCDITWPTFTVHENLERTPPATIQQGGRMLSVLMDWEESDVVLFRNCCSNRFGNIFRSCQRLLNTLNFANLPRQLVDPVYPCQRAVTVLSRQINTFDIFQNVMKWGGHSVATPTLLCHKEPAQGTQSPLLGALGRNAPY